MVKGFFTCGDGEELCVWPSKPGKSECYNPETDMCCAGEVRTKADHLSCCAAISGAMPGSVYDNNEKICCNGSVVDKIDGRGCCGGDFFNTTEQICCTHLDKGHLHDRYQGQAFRPYSTCCGSRPYDPLEELCFEGISKFSVTRYSRDTTLICCDDKAIDANVDMCRPRTARLMCAGDEYDPRDELCCQGSLLRRWSGYQHCCGNKTYDDRNQKCCDDEYAIVKYTDEGGVPVRQQCCKRQPNGGAVSVAGHICCNGHPFRRESARARCCNSDVIDTATQSCCDGRVFNMSTHRCCASELQALDNPQLSCCKGQSMNPELSVCCSLSGPHTKKWGRDSCCEHPGNRVRSEHPGGRHKNRLYDSSIDKCVDGKVFRLTTLVCGRRRYDPNRKICCNGHARPRGAGVKCCGFGTYHPDYQTCCNGHMSYGPQSAHVCHGKQAIAIARSCAGDLSLCGGQCYDAQHKYCCKSGNISFVRRQREGRPKECPCSVTKAYNPDIEKCVGSDVLPLDQ